MKKIPFSILLAIVWLMTMSIQSQAQISMMTNIVNDIPPRPIDTSNPPSPFRYSDLRSIYDSGIGTSDATLTGKWKLVAQATTAICADMGLDSYDPNGIKNSDGTIATLTFQTVMKPLPPGSGESVTPMFAVVLNNMGGAGADQGPYAVSPNEPQFAQWVYGYGKLLDVAYFSYSCRLSAKDRNTLICGLKLKILDHTKIVISERSLACAHSGQLGAMFVFSK